ncbi:hypothetical protein TRICI_006046 [Trichomonascus ciferrii]|uniref:RecA family profile 1 domain-containing protein n=1 Tax=Trichomonascus ciferrii TaxID=44093 RepID=A0A642UM26_9ASCO|nr:hypothetical protein TRICI_006046 [Trichomonascus ciferrii]
MTTLTEIFQHARSTQDPDTAFRSGARELDALLGPRGLGRQHVVEISGPPGSGKTTVGLQLSLDALRRGHRVLWMSTTNHPLPVARMEAMPHFRPLLLHNMFHIRLDTVAQFLSIVQTGAALPADVALVVVDGVDGLLEQSTHDRRQWKAHATDAVFDLLHRLAVHRDAAVLMLNNMKTTGGGASAATLIPGLEYGLWDKKYAAALSRLVLYRDVGPADDDVLLLRPINSRLSAAALCLSQHGIADAQNHASPHIPSKRGSPSDKGPDPVNKRSKNVVSDSENDDQEIALL